jgi:3-oxoacyl-(acyl-carrier-protein) synthase III
MSIIDAQAARERRMTREAGSRTALPGRDSPLVTTFRGVGVCIPEHAVTTSELVVRGDLEQRFAMTAEAIERLTGVRERRWAKPGVMPSDLAASAATEALESAGLIATDVDAVLFAGITKDLLEPGTASIVADKIGARNARVMDVSNACNGLLDATDIADSMIGMGKMERVLVTTGERVSISVSWEASSRREMVELLASLSVCDGGGALVLEASHDASRGIVERCFRSNPGEWRHATALAFDYSQAVPGGASFDPIFRSNGTKLYEAASRLLIPMIEEVLERSGWSYADVDLFLTHEASREFINRGLDCMPAAGQVGPRLWSTIEKYGNSNTFSVPLALHQARDAGVLEPGSKVLIGAGSSGASAAVMSLVW